MYESRVNIAQAPFVSSPPSCSLFTEILHKATSPCNGSELEYARLPFSILTRDVRMQLVDESPAWNDPCHRINGRKHRLP